MPAWLLALAAACLPVPAAAGADDAPRPQWIVAGYLASWSTYGDGPPIAAIRADRLTHILYAFGSANASGLAELADPCADIGRCGGGDDSGGNFRELVRLKERHPHLRVLIAIGGWNGSAHFSRIAATPEARERFVRSAIDVFIGGYPELFDGVDIDWEYPVEGGLPDNARSPADRENFTLLMREFRLRLDDLERQSGRRYQLSAAVSAQAAAQGNVQLPELARVVDFISVMTYDYHVGTAYAHFNAPLFALAGDPTPHDTVDASVRSLLAAGVPADRLVLGIPFYGRAYGGVDAVDDGLLRPGSEGSAPGWAADGVDYRALADGRLAEAGFRLHWNTEAQVPFMYDPASRVWISFDDPRSVAAKAAYAAAGRLAGVMVWQLGGDDGTLLSAIGQGLSQAPAAKAETSGSSGAPSSSSSPTQIDSSVASCPGGHMTCSPAGRE